MAPVKPLFDDEEDIKEQELQLRVNEEYAKRFEHNKKREELHRLQEKYPEQAAKLTREHARQAALATKAATKANARAQVAAEQEEEDEESSSDGEDDDEGLISDKKEAQILETLMKIRARDASIYDATAKFYSSESEGEEGEEEDGKGQGGKKDKPMYLKDVIYQQAVQGGGDSSSDEEGKAPAPRTYAQEQQELKQAFLSAFEENEAGAEGAAAEEFGAGVLKQKQKAAKKAAAAAAAAAAAGEDGEDEEGAAAGGGDEGAASARVQQLLDGFFGRDQELSADDRFLKRYILNKGWVEEGDEGYDDEELEEGANHGLLADEGDEEDEEFLEQAEQFEHAYNFRFEEPGGAAIVTYPRNLEGTVRKEDDRRKRKRAEKAARQAAEEEARRAEVRRLKNLKKAEIEEKLQEIQSVAGRSAPRQDLLDALVAGDFDPEEYDKQMAAAFGDDYYEGEEDEDLDDLEDEAFEKELEAIAQYGSDEESADPHSFVAMHKRLAAQRREEAAAAGEEASDEEDGGEADGQDPEAAAKARAEVQRLLEEYYKLDYEDVVGGIPTRFRYKEVDADSYGLSVEDILGLEDKELNQVVGLKRLAPYREEHRRFRPNYGKLKELKQQRDQQQQEQRGGGGGGGGGKQGWGKPRWQQQHNGGGGGGGGGKQGKWKGAGQQQQQRRQPWKGGAGGDGQQQERQQQPAKTAEQRRLESFAKPSLKKDKQQQQQQQQGGGGNQQQQQHREQQHSGNKRKREQQQDGGSGSGGGGKQQVAAKAAQQAQQQAGQDDGGPKMSKAAKKNMKRAEKRAAKRTKSDGGEGQ